MAELESVDNGADVPEIHIVSGGVGASAELLTHTVLAQFPGVQPELVVHSHVHSVQDVNEIVAAVSKANSILLHTLVNTELREALIS